MTRRSILDRLLGRDPSPAAAIELGPRPAPRVPPPPPPPPARLPGDPDEAWAAPAPTASSPPPTRVRVVLADGTETTLEADPEITTRAAYLARSMLPPKPPQAPGSSDAQE